MVKAFDIWPGLALLAFGIFILFDAQQWVFIDAKGPGPGLFPMIEGVAIVGLSAILLIGSVRRLAAGGALVGAWWKSRRVLATAGALMACALLLDVLGFAICIALLTLFIVTVMYRRPILVGLAVAIGSAAGLYLCFVVALDVRLPTGVLGF